MADATRIPCGDGVFWLAGVRDVFSNRIVGWKTSTKPGGSQIPYWELREHSSVATGIERPFLTAYREGSFHYLLIVADRI